MYDDACRAVVKFLNCQQESLATLCGTEIATWQREMTTKMMMMMMNSDDDNCIFNVIR